MQTRQSDRFTTITIEGAVLPPDLLKRIADSDKDLLGLDRESYHLGAEKLNEVISHSWSRARTLWQGFQLAKAALPSSDPGTRLTQEKWLLQLLKLLDYGQLQSAPPVDIEGKRYAISHSWGHTPIHLVSFKADLDKRPEHVAEGEPRMSPHGLVQEFLNRSPGHLWAFLSNGLQLRILRDNVNLTRQAFVDFDLEAMFQGEVYPDFVLLWLLCHQSRVEGDKPEQCWLEKWSKEAQERGTRALDQLRDGVQTAIEALGRGFLVHPANAQLKASLSDGRAAAEYYRHLLRLVYRLIFLFVAEDRELLLKPGEPPEVVDRYRRFYSTQRIRQMARTVRGTPHGDLWQGLVLVMTKLGDDLGGPELGLPALGSFLWSPGAIGELAANQISNRDLLNAFRAITFTEENKFKRFIDYRNLGSEELGSIYESLLELHPQRDPQTGAFTLASASGNDRKTTGSYYTPTSLVNCLLDSALNPVLDEACKKPDPAKAILALRVIDPACGSGHFLIAAAHRISRRLAFIRTGNEEPAPKDVRVALRDVISHCIHGVDLNDMAVELAKVSLWMESMVPGLPLSFLDSKIQLGNALLGATPALIKQGIPEAAYQAIEGDDKKVVAALKKRNKDELVGQGSLFWGTGTIIPPFSDRMHGIDAIPDGLIQDVHAKESAFEQFVKSKDYQHQKALADTWCASFVWKKTNSNAITTDAIRRLEASPTGLLPMVQHEVNQLAKQYQFLHWHLAFPSVCREPTAGDAATGETGWAGGFDVVLGNPPWERVKLQEKEWFAARKPEIASAGKVSERRSLIAALETSQFSADKQLFADFLDARRHTEAESHFIRSSGRYPLCGQGDINTYTVFAETNWSLIRASGRVGCIVPTGIATDETTKEFFQAVVENRALVSLFDFQTGGELFGDIGHARFRFCLLTMTARGAGPEVAAFVFFAREVDHVTSDKKRFTLSPSEIKLVNPNTRTCPVFSTRVDATIAQAVYARLPVLVLDGPPAKNPWGLTIRRVFDMNQVDTIAKCASTPRKLSNDLPMYEAKMVHQYDHRYGTYQGKTTGQGTLPRLSLQMQCNPTVSTTPRYWVAESTVRDAGLSGWSRNWLMVWRDICRNSDERTVIATIVPYSATDFTLRVGFLESQEPKAAALLVAQMNSLVFDYNARQKMGGTHLSDYVTKQLPVLDPIRFKESVGWLTDNFEQWCVGRVLELVYTSHDMEPFARDLGFKGKPFVWDEARRAQLRAELDASFFHLYGLTRDEVVHVLDSFTVLKKTDQSKYNEYRTGRMVLECYDTMATQKDLFKSASTLLAAESSAGGFFDEPLAQSKAKAAIVSDYFEAWAMIISNQPNVSRLSYIDLFSGPGRYADGTPSTPLRVLEKVVATPRLANSVVSIFNDADRDLCTKLEKEILALPGINTLRYQPVIYTNEVDDKIAMRFESQPMSPTLLFLDPFGYSGLTLRLIGSVLKDWASECIVFFNYNRINAAITNDKVGNHMAALFGPRINPLRARLKDKLNPQEREKIVLEEFIQALASVNGHHALCFTFKREDENRTSHHLIFVTKNKLGYGLMKEVMAPQSSVENQGVPTLIFDPRQVNAQLQMVFVKPIDELAAQLLKVFKGQKRTAREVYEDHNMGTPYLLKNYKEALLKLEASGQVLCHPAHRPTRSGQKTLADNVKIMFP